VKHVQVKRQGETHTGEPFTNDKQVEKVTDVKHKTGEKTGCTW
jgi:hypothetical protein